MIDYCMYFVDLETKSAIAASSKMRRLEWHRSCKTNPLIRNFLFATVGINALLSFAVAEPRVVGSIA